MDFNVLSLTGLWIYFQSWPHLQDISPVFLFQAKNKKQFFLILRTKAS